MSDGTEVYRLVQFFENFLNTMYSGEDLSFVTSADTTDTSATKYIYIPPESTDENTIGILEKVNRLTELHDPDVIDIDYIQYFASNLGYNVNIDRGEIGTFVNDNSDELNKYLRFVVSNLPNWYKIKTTRNAIKVLLYSYGLIGDIAYYYTNNYLPETEGGNWISDSYTLGTPSLDDIPGNYYPTPYFVVWVDVDNSNNLNWSFDNRQQILKAIESIRPINTVFRNLGAYAVRKIDMYIAGWTRLSRYIRINDELPGDYWV